MSRLPFSYSSLLALPFDRPPRLAAGFRWWGACAKVSSWRRCRSASTTPCPSSTSSPPTRCSWTTSGPSATNCAKSWSVSPPSPTQPSTHTVMSFSSSIDWKNEFVPVHSGGISGQWRHPAPIKKERSWSDPGVHPIQTTSQPCKDTSTQIMETLPPIHKLIPNIYLWPFAVH